MLRPLLAAALTLVVLPTPTAAAPPAANVPGAATRVPSNGAVIRRTQYGVPHIPDGDASAK